LRTPLMPIVGWSRMLQDGRLAPGDHKRGLQIIERNANTQAKLIEDLLDISTIISGKLALKLEPAGVAQVIEAAMEAVRPAALAKKIALRFTLEQSVGPIICDPLRVQQVIWNLLNNAVKFTDEGGAVEIHARPVEDFAQITVSDNGIGVEAKFLPFMFERFSQSDSSTTRKHGGMGIGLFIVKQLVALHGGRVTVNSEGPGKGTTFTVELPLPEKSNGETNYPLKAVDELEDTTLLGKTILVVDDEEDAREFLAFALRRAGAQVFMASSASEALSKIADTQIDVLVSDIGMPEVDGYELIQKVRRSGSMIPAIAVTSFARGEDSVRATDAGFTRHLAKPVNPSDLCTAVAAVLAAL
jgi:CheY-like chemotaxis protein/anti-sigma regulatory factor (Ser/Thr protein kinase)